VLDDGALARAVDEAPVVADGGGGMPAFGGRLTKPQIAAVAKYVSSVAGTK
jgi:mono/diheme cytochrome c family protein